MKHLSILGLFIFFSTKNFAQQAYWQQQVNYNIAVSLNDQNHTLDALEKIVYYNNSPDTLKFIWFHIWPNAYRNDKTAFSEQLLVNGRTDFYFSNDTNRGFISRLDFTVDNAKARFEMHPQHIDIIKLLLPNPLPPKSSVSIETPFHVKLPYNFSRGGHVLNDYQITQWYPKPAVYDKQGWHPMPYLDQGEFYSEFGNYEVSITLPDNYLVAATGELQTSTELEKLKQIGKTKIEQQTNYSIADAVVEKKSWLPAKPVRKTKKAETKIVKTETAKTKTLIYKQDNVHDFAWFASRNFLVQYDTVQLKNKIVDCFSFFPKAKANKRNNNIQYIKTTLKKYSKWVGEYPYNIASVVVGKTSKEDGMEYPTITYINYPDSSWISLELISHELGHNWFYGILASNERDHAWMDEGMNTYYDERYSDESPRSIAVKDKQGKKKFMPDTTVIDKDFDALFHTLKGIQKNVPLDTDAIAFPKQYYGLLVYQKGAYILQYLHSTLGKAIFDSAMRTYYNEWKFKHPQPKDFQEVMERISGKSLNHVFAKLHNDEPFFSFAKRPVKLSFSIPIPKKDMMQNRYTTLMPAPSYNFYDGIRLGAILHNYQLPLPKFQFFVNPTYGTTSKQFNFFGRASYNVYKKKSWLELSASYQQYTYDDFVSDAGDKYLLGIQRFVPSVKYTLYKDDIRSTQRTVIGFKTFYLKEQNLLFGDADKITTPSTKTYINRLYITKFDNRVLYPYSLNLTIDQGEEFVRAAFTAKQFFNYAKHTGGIEARFFAGKFFYTQSKTLLSQYYTDRYHLNMSGANGSEDYTYSDYFVGRGEFEGWKSQQIMERDGFFKARSDLYSSKIGKTDDWLMAANFNIDCPGAPAFKLFADIGTYADAWSETQSTGKFLFDAGFQLSLFKNTINIYAPVLFSKVYRDYNKSVLVDKIFQRTISFSINLQNLHFNKLNGGIPL